MQKYTELAAKDKERYEHQLSTYVKPEQPEGLAEAGKRRKRSPNAPKHPISAYLFYVAEQRRKLCAQTPGKSFKEMATYIGGRWKSLSREDRSVRYCTCANKQISVSDSALFQPYVKSALMDKKRYEKEKAESAVALNVCESGDS